MEFVRFRVRQLVAASLLLLVAPFGFAIATECTIASAHPLASAAGCEILDQGGNAFDAAVAVTAALAVVEPYSSGLGGGGFYLLHRADDGFEVFIDARETAPGEATADRYVDEAGQPKSRMSREGPTAAGIPGIPAAADWITRRYGKLPLEKTLAPAIRLADEGFPADARYVRASGYMAGVLNRYPQTAAIFLDQGKSVAPGAQIRLPLLAATLRRLAVSGSADFYRGEIARAMVEAVRAAGGFWRLQDLANYRVVEREPFRLTFRGARITTAPLPSSGGLVMAETLNILNGFPIENMTETLRVHYIVEAMRRGYNDRARFMGDPDFTYVPIARLRSMEYARRRAASIDPDHATPSADLPSVGDPHEEGEETTHFSIVDAAGNRVAATLSVNGPFGAGFVAGDTGVLLNNHMDDFALAPATANLYQLVGDEANAIAPGKRPLSSMSPTFVEDSRGVLVFGTPGGSRIISMVILGIVDYLLNPQVDIQRVVALPRYHHQYLPDRIEYEPGGFGDDWVQALQLKGHTVEAGRRKWGNMQAVFVDAESGLRIVANDPRGRAGVLF